MSNYVVIESCGKGIIAQWYEPQIKTQKRVTLFHSFEEAQAYMRKSIKTLVSRSKGFGLEEGKPFEPFKYWLEEYRYSEDEQEDRAYYEAADKLIRQLVFDESYLPAEDDIVEFDFDDEGDWCFNYLIEKDRVIVTYYGLQLSFNIHAPNRPQHQYFCFKKEDDDGPIGEIAVELIKVRD